MENSTPPGSEENNRSDQENGRRFFSSEQDDPTRIHIKRAPGELVGGIFEFLKSILSLRRTNYKYTEIIEEAKESVVFEGYNVWVLICSILIASIGLNVDSIPVVIGAMLISPLMGPIRGLGFGVGMNDLPLLYSSLKNFGVMVGVSLATSIFYFSITPLDVETNELLGRTEPSFLDAMIAFFGGLAGVISFTNGKKDTVVSGVAIATALMPPLCTAGYGIANGEWGYFLGAAYLFLLNSLFIALSTVILLRYVRFPKRHYISKTIERRVQGFIITFLILILTPSGYLLYKIAKRSIFENNVDRFVKEIIETSESNLIVNKETSFDWDNSVIQLSVVNSYIDSTTLGMWNRQKHNYDLDFAKIRIIQGDDLMALTDKKIKEALGMSSNQNELVNLLKEKELKIAQMESEFEAYRRSESDKKDKLDLAYIMKGFQEEYDELDRISINRSFTYNNKNKLDTTYIIAVSFADGIAKTEQQKMKARISKRFRFELKESSNIELDTVSVVNF